MSGKSARALRRRTPCSADPSPCPCATLFPGTPIQNDLSEFHAVYEVACPGLLGNANEFRRKACGQAWARRGAWSVQLRAAYAACRALARPRQGICTPPLSSLTVHRLHATLQPALRPIPHTSQYELPIQRGRDADASEAQVERGLGAMNELMELCNKFMLRRTSTVLKKLLPAKVEQVWLGQQGGKAGVTGRRGVERALRAGRSPAAIT